MVAKETKDKDSDENENSQEVWEGQKKGINCIGGKMHPEKRKQNLKIN